MDKLSKEEILGIMWAYGNNCTVNGQLGLELPKPDLWLTGYKPELQSQEQPKKPDYNSGWYEKNQVGQQQYQSDLRKWQSKQQPQEQPKEYTDIDLEKLAEDYRINECGADATEKYLEKAFIAGYKAASITNKK